MIPRNDVLSLYKLILGRDPESEEVINEKRRSPTVADVAFEMLRSDEFMTRNKALLSRLVE
jgi:hypothetical protein